MFLKNHLSRLNLMFLKTQMSLLYLNYHLFPMNLKTH
jgi:hypothetical protein